MGRQVSSINYAMINGQKLKFLTKLDIPKQIYVRKESDIVKQLSTLGTTTYINSHAKVYGGAMEKQVSNN